MLKEPLKSQLLVAYKSNDCYCTIVGVFVYFVCSNTNAPMYTTPVYSNTVQL